MKDDVEVAAYVARQEERKKFEAKLAESTEAERRKYETKMAESVELIASLQAENSKYIAENSKYMAEIAMLREMLAQKG